MGVPMAAMIGWAKGRPKDHALAAALWADGRYEARTLAALIDDPAQVTTPQMDDWVAAFDNWAICDTVAFRLFDRTPDRWSRPAVWAASEALYVRRAAFALLWALALHDKGAGAAEIHEGLRLAEGVADDDRPHVQKAVSMAVRAIGQRRGQRQTALDWALRVEGRGKTAARTSREVRRALGQVARSRTA
ncbi:MAG: hypothetical protein RLZZ528_1348 [Pseudomonadota bacterium]|jgi:3-methyladenine DNA glycosylase AlkD